MEQAVGVIEPELLHQDEDGQLQQGPLDGWNLSGLFVRFYCKEYNS